MTPDRRRGCQCVICKSGDTPGQVLALLTTVGLIQHRFCNNTSLSIKTQLGYTAVTHRMGHRLSTAKQG